MHGKRSKVRISAIFWGVMCSGGRLSNPPKPHKRPRRWQADGETDW